MFYRRLKDVTFIHPKSPLQGDRGFLLHHQPEPITMNIHDLDILIFF